MQLLRFLRSEFLYRRLASQDILPAAIVSVHAERLRHEAEGFFVAPAVKAEGHLAAIPVEEISLAEGASCEKLYGVHAAHVRLGDRHDLLVVRPGAQLPQRHLGGADAQRQAGTGVAVKGDDLL